MQLVQAVLYAAGSKGCRTMASLGAADRSWVVAGLTLYGLTAEEIADRLSCSLRLVRSIRAEDMTQMALLMQTESRNFGDELRLERSEHGVTRQAFDDLAAAHRRVKAQLDQLLDTLQTRGEVQTFLCGHPMLDFNMYRNCGKRYCRMCRAARQAEWRKNRLSCGVVNKLTTPTLAAVR